MKSHVEGVTTFAAKSYRYIIELKSSGMSIWIEDRTSKKQWFKGGMDITDYVSSANAIPDASAADYVKCFQDVLDYKLDDSNDVQRKLHLTNDGGVRLKLSVVIRVFRSMCVAAYTFELDPVSVERIDILESKVRDQQEELEKLRGDMKDSEAQALVKFTASIKDGSSIICWNAFKSDVFISTGLDGKIRFLRGGVYSIGAVVATQSGSGQKVELRKNGLPIQVAYTGHPNGYGCSTTLCAIEQLEKDDKLTTTCLSQLVASSYLSIYRLGN